MQEIRFDDIAVARVNASVVFRRLNTKLPGFQNEAFVAGTARYLLPIEILQQGNGVLSRDAGEVLERGDIN